MKSSRGGGGGATPCFQRRGRGPTRWPLTGGVFKEVGSSGAASPESSVFRTRGSRRLIGSWDFLSEPPQIVGAAKNVSGAALLPPAAPRASDPRRLPAHVHAHARASEGRVLGREREEERGCQSPP